MPVERERLISQAMIMTKIKSQDFSSHGRYIVLSCRAAECLFEVYEK